MNTRIIYRLCVLGVVFWLALPARVQAGSVWYVAGFGDDANDCRSPQTACASIQAALDKEEFTAGDTVLLEDRSYNALGTPSEAVVSIEQDVTISGGWNSSFTEQTDYSIIIGLYKRGIIISSGAKVMLEDIIVSDTQSGVGGGSGIHNAGLLTLANVLVGDAERGCGIHNEGTLTMRHSAVSSTYLGSGICNLGTLTIEDSTSYNHSSSCAGLVNSGTLLMRRSALRDNGVHDSLGSGGGLCNFGTATLLDSSILNNRLVAEYGWPGLEVTGGGIYNAGTLTLVNTTVATNFADHGGGGIYNVGTLTLRNVTLYDNHSDSGAAGLANFGTVSIQNSILAANTNDAGSANCAGAILSDGYNLLDDTTGCPWTATIGDLLNMSPQLLPARATAYGFGINGAQVFYPPARSSPVIDAGNPAGCTDGAGEPLPTDQRGAARALDGNGDGTPRCDMGTNEFDPTEFRYLFLPLVGR